jgi:hypothetical protein
MIITTKQMEAIDEIILDQYIRNSVNKLRLEFPEDLVTYGNVRTWILHARAYGIIHNMDVDRYLILCCRIPEMRNEEKPFQLEYYLTHPDISEGKKLDLVTDAVIAEESS